MQAVEITESACAPTPTLSVLVPVYNEIEVLPAFHQRMTAVLRASVDTYEVLYVNDGSSDGSLAWLEQLCGVDANVALVDLSRNFGKEIAMAAGLDGVVCSPLEAGRIHETCTKDFVTVTPGIRFADAKADDQVRITTPAKAREIGSDYIAVGRPITQAEDPVAAYRRCVSEFVG